jgi:hypothetical protein
VSVVQSDQHPYRTVAIRLKQERNQYTENLTKLPATSRQEDRNPHQAHLYSEPRVMPLSARAIFRTSPNLEGTKTLLASQVQGAKGIRSGRIDMITGQ